MFIKFLSFVCRSLADIEEKWRTEKDQAIADFKKRGRDVSFQLILPFADDNFFRQPTS